MSGRWSTVPTTRRRASAWPRPVARASWSGFLIAALLGLVTGLGWMGCQFVRNQFGG